jgi:Holliday junction DNA helicase RuvA
MIAHLNGKLLEKSTDYAVIETSGVGYLVYLSSNSLAHLGDIGTQTEMHIYTHVREDQLSLFGFVTKEEKAIFQRLINVSGIGPKMALAILSGLTPGDLVQAVIKEDLVRLHAISGVGKKTAERIVVDLKDKFVKDFANIGISAPQSNKPLYNDALSALINLGYPRSTAERVLTTVGVGKHKDVQSVIKHALRELAQGNN